jgi:hypothetical protein
VLLFLHFVLRVLSAETGVKAMPGTAVLRRHQDAVNRPQMTLRKWARTQAGEYCLFSIPDQNIR